MQLLTTEELKLHILRLTGLLHPDGLSLLDTWPSNIQLGFPDSSPDWTSLWPKLNHSKSLTDMCATVVSLAILV